jgi:ATP-dependent RNA helicase RhlB
MNTVMDTVTNEPGEALPAFVPGVPARTKIRFQDFDLPAPLLKAIEELGFEYCTPIQAQSLRITLKGHDVTGKAQTGTGKTAAFLTAIITDQLRNPVEEERFVGEPRALVIAPTRELVMQIAKDAKALCKYSGLRVLTLVGGIDYEKQKKARTGSRHRRYRGRHAWSLAGFRQPACHFPGAGGDAGH